MSNILLTRKALTEIAPSWRRRKRRVVFTNGVFDVLHRAHIELLETAKGYGDILVVGLNSDASTRRLKGDGRPINTQRDRARVLGALRAVNHVCVFSEDTPLNLICVLKPDVLVKGSEYEISEIVGADEVRSWGGTVRRFRMRNGYSTTSLIEKMADSHRR